MVLDTVINGESLFKLIQSQHPKLILIDARPFSEYIKGHVPGAINIDLMHFHWFDTSKKGILQFEKQMKLLLNYLGIESSSIVVFYDDISGSTAARGVWLLHYFSHQNAFILNGGFKEWSKLDNPIEIKSNQFKHSKFIYNINKNVLADVKYLQSILNKNSQNVTIIDCRSEEEYNGSFARAFHRGHIPRSINIDWTNNLENDRFMEYNELEKLYSFLPKETEIITYCQGGYRAANTYLILKHLGYPNVKMYLGSWGEWGNNPTLPVE